MFSLPRGTGVTADVPLATAAWESPQAVERLAYRGGGSLFVGAIPAFENWPELSRLCEQGGAYLSALENSGLPPLRRAERVSELERLWRAAQLADCIPLGIDDDRHFVTVAGSRAGKGRSGIIPNLCIYTGSVVCLDPKGENATLTAARRGAGCDGCEGMGQEVFVLDPFGVTAVPDAVRAGLNPLALLDPNSPLVVNDAEMLAEGLIVSTNSEDSHWDETAKILIKGVILHLITTTERPSLLTLRRFLARGDVEGWEDAGLAVADSGGDRKEFQQENPTAFRFLLNAMKANEHEKLSGVIAAAAEALSDCGDREFGTILSTARRNTAFLDTIAPRFVETLEARGRTFAPAIFKKAEHGASLYLCLPAERMGTHGRWLRMMIGLLLEHAYRDLSRPACGAPFLFLLEEFFSLGHMPVIEKAAGYAAGFGVKLWAILQDLQQLKALYPKSWQTFLANAGAVQVFGVSDADTTEFVSKALGQVEITKHTRNRADNYSSSQSTGNAHAKASGVVVEKNKISPLRLLLSAVPDGSTSESRNVSETVNEQFQKSPLLLPDEITIQFARETGAGLLLIKGRKPVWYLRVDYDASPWFWGRFVPSDAEKARGGVTLPFGARTPDRLKAVAEEFARFGDSI
jgi:type IV secretion system protein VirD4